VRNVSANTTSYTWYRIRITRSTAWAFIVYVKWGAYANYTQLLTYTDNAITTSNFFVTNLSTLPWSKICDYIIKQWVEV
jgi:hypothetical protein